MRHSGGFTVGGSSEADQIESFLLVAHCGVRISQDAFHGLFSPAASETSAVHRMPMLFALVTDVLSETNTGSVKSDSICTRDSQMGHTGKYQISLSGWVP